MKNLTLINNQWKQRVDPNITAEERAILADKSEDNIEAVSVLMESIKYRSMIDVSIEEATSAQSIYDRNKIEEADFISVDIILPRGSGIINCRISGQHKQIRF